MEGQYFPLIVLVDKRCRTIYIYSVYCNVFKCDFSFDTKQKNKHLDFIRDCFLCDKDLYRIKNLM